VVEPYFRETRPADTFDLHNLSNLTGKFERAKVKGKFLRTQKVQTIFEYFLGISEVCKVAYED
jgi:hypothetical protein